jgi:UDP-N-acetylglucosamine--N-acetylmuramyl-(pentapeptide) pyrophosphoryl-undecaprenol N-acetylglucosamine transferase
MKLCVAHGSPVTTHHSPFTPHYVFAGGGTLGHLFPGLAVAEQLARAEPNARITFAGNGRECEQELVSAAAYEYLRVACRSWPRRPWAAGGFALRNFAGFMVARRYLRRERVSVVVGLGAFASAPVAKAALSLQLPLVLVEQNAVPGRVNRWLAPRADAFCAAFDSVRSWLPKHDNIVVTGTPVRSMFSPCELVAPRERLLVVLGGSRGAERLNQAVPQFAEQVVAAGWKIIHQSGQAGAASTAARYTDLGASVQVVPFIADMPAELSRAGLVVCRGGGSTLAELAVTATPAVVCPYPHATDDHQRRNSIEFAAAGACVVVDQREAETARLADEVSTLFTDADRRESMSQAMRSLSRPDAARHVADIVLDVARPKSRRGEMVPSQGVRFQSQRPKT